MRLWPLTLLRKLRDRSASRSIQPMDPREQQCLDHLREQRLAKASPKEGAPPA